MEGLKDIYSKGIENMEFGDFMGTMEVMPLILAHMSIYGNNHSFASLPPAFCRPTTSTPANSRNKCDH